MAAQYRITEDDYANAARFHAWRHFIARPSTAQFAYGSILVALLGICMWALPAVVPVFVVGGAMLAIMIAFALLVRTPRRARRNYRQYKAIQELITAELTETGINQLGEWRIKFAMVEDPAGAAERSICPHLSDAGSVLSRAQVDRAAGI
jgi:hypothetical protein